MTNKIDRTKHGLHWIILSGGSGKRLWPLSNEVRSKQFLKIFPKEDGTYESMLQKMYSQIRRKDPGADITIATAHSQISSILNQLLEKPDICPEPCRKDTFPAVCLAASYLKDVKEISEEDCVVVCPVDPYVEEDYFNALQELGQMAAAGEGDLFLLGIAPSYPSAKYGYILPASRDRVSDVLSFREKPDELTAEKYIAKGALWNGGVFACRLGYLLKKAHEKVGYAGYADLLRKYESLKAISFDYAVAEGEKRAKVVRFDGSWKDLGTWNTLTEAMKEPCMGNAVLSDSCENVHVINELDVPVLAMGLKNVVISASPDGILVSDKDQSSYMKPYVDRMENRIMFAEKSWGSFRVIDVEKESLTIKVTLNPGHQMNYHSHERREEVWTVISGSGRAVLDGKALRVCPGDILRIPTGCRHTIQAKTELKLIEVQLGKEISVSDKKKYPMP